MFCIFLYAGFVWWLFGVFREIPEPRPANSPKVWTEGFAKAAKAFTQKGESRGSDSPTVWDDELARHARALTNLSR